MDKGLRILLDRAGSKSALARTLGIQRQAVSAWRKVPLKRLPQIRSEYGLSFAELRPDWFSK